MPHDLPSADMMASAKWLVRALLTVHPGVPRTQLSRSGLALGRRYTGSHSPCWLHSSPMKLRSSSPIGLLSIPSEQNPAADAPLSADAARAPLARALRHVVGELPLRWHTAGDLDACAGERAPHDWCVMLPVSQRVQPGVYTLMALSWYRDALVQHRGPERPLVYQPLIPQILTACYHIVLLPPRAFDTHPPVTRDVYYAVSFCSYAQLTQNSSSGTSRLGWTRRPPLLSSLLTLVWKVMFVLPWLMRCSRMDLHLRLPSPQDMCKPCGQTCGLKHFPILRGSPRIPPSWSTANPAS